MAGKTIKLIDKTVLGGEHAALDVPDVEKVIELIDEHASTSVGIIDFSFTLSNIDPSIYRMSAELRGDMTSLALWFTNEAQLEWSKQTGTYDVSSDITTFTATRLASVGPLYKAVLADNTGLYPDMTTSIATRIVDKEREFADALYSYSGTFSKIVGDIQQILQSDLTRVSQNYPNIEISIGTMIYDSDGTLGIIRTLGTSPGYVAVITVTTAGGSGIGVGRLITNQIEFSLDITIGGSLSVPKLAVQSIVGEIGIGSILFTNNGTTCIVTAVDATTYTIYKAANTQTSLCQTTSTINPQSAAITYIPVAYVSNQIGDVTSGAPSSRIGMFVADLQGTLGFIEFYESSDDTYAIKTVAFSNTTYVYVPISSSDPAFYTLFSNDTTQLGAVINNWSYTYINTQSRYPKPTDIIIDSNGAMLFVTSVNYNTTTVSGYVIKTPGHRPNALQNTNGSVININGGSSAVIRTALTNMPAMAGDIVIDRFGSKGIVSSVYAGDDYMLVQGIWKNPVARTTNTLNQIIGNITSIPIATIIERVAGGSISGVMPPPIYSLIYDNNGTIAVVNSTAPVGSTTVSCRTICSTIVGTVGVGSIGMLSSPMQPSIGFSNNVLASSIQMFQGALNVGTLLFQTGENGTANGIISRVISMQESNVLVEVIATSTPPCLRIVDTAPITINPQVGEITNFNYSVVENAGGMQTKPASVLNTLGMLVSDRSGVLGRVVGASTYNNTINVATIVSSQPKVSTTTATLPTTGQTNVQFSTMSRIVGGYYSTTSRPRPGEFVFDDNGTLGIFDQVNDGDTYGRLRILTSAGSGGGSGGIPGLGRTSIPIQEIVGAQVTILVANIAMDSGTLGPNTLIYSNYEGALCRVLSQPELGTVIAEVISASSHAGFIDFNISSRINTTIGGVTTFNEIAYKSFSTSYPNAPAEVGAIVHDADGTVGIVTFLNLEDTTFTVRTLSTSGGSGSAAPFNLIKITAPNTLKNIIGDTRDFESTEYTVESGTPVVGKTIVTDTFGNIGNVTFYDHALDVLQVQTIATSGSGGTAPFNFIRLTSGAELSDYMGSTKDFESTEYTVESGTPVDNKTIVYDDAGRTGVVTSYDSATGFLQIRTMTKSGRDPFNLAQTMSTAQLSSTLGGNTILSDTQYAMHSGMPEIYKTIVFDESGNLGIVANVNEMSYEIDVVTITTSSSGSSYPFNFIEIVLGWEMTKTIGEITTFAATEYTPLSGHAAAHALVFDGDGTIGMVESVDTATGEIEVETIALSNAVNIGTISSGVLEGTRYNESIAFNLSDVIMNAGSMLKIGAILTDDYGYVARVTAIDILGAMVTCIVVASAGTNIARLNTALLSTTIYNNTTGIPNAQYANISGASAPAPRLGALVLDSAGTLGLIYDRSAAAGTFDVKTLTTSGGGGTSTPPSTWLIQESFTVPINYEQIISRSSIQQVSGPTSADPKVGELVFSRYSSELAVIDAVDIDAVRVRIIALSQGSGYVAPSRLAGLVGDVTAGISWSDYNRFTGLSNVPGKGTLVVDANGVLGMIRSVNTSAQQFDVVTIALTGESHVSMVKYNGIIKRAISGSIPEIVLKGDISVLSGSIQPNALVFDNVGNIGRLGMIGSTEVEMYTHSVSGIYYDMAETSESLPLNVGGSSSVPLSSISTVSAIPGNLIRDISGRTGVMGEITGDTIRVMTISSPPIIGTCLAYLDATNNPVRLPRESGATDSILESSLQVINGRRGVGSIVVDTFGVLGMITGAGLSPGSWTVTTQVASSIRTIATTGNLSATVGGSVVLDLTTIVGTDDVVPGRIVVNTTQHVTAVVQLVDDVVGTFTAVTLGVQSSGTQGVELATESTALSVTIGAYTTINFTTSSWSGPRYIGVLVKDDIGTVGYLTSDDGTVGSVRTLSATAAPPTYTWQTVVWP